MAVSSVHSSNDATTQAIQQQQQKKNASTQQADNTGNQPNITRQSQAQTQKVQQQVPTQTTQAPKPVVNGQGQKTGQILNATA